VVTNVVFVTLTTTTTSTTSWTHEVFSDFFMVDPKNFDAVRRIAVAAIPDAVKLADIVVTSVTAGLEPYCTDDAAAGRSRTKAEAPPRATVNKFAAAKASNRR
jgi:hypothetical protein